jgi:nucleotide-binding universal stress UspA family protein
MIDKIAKILVAADYSTANQAVFDQAVSLAKTTGASLMIMHILAEDELNFPVIHGFIDYPVLDDYDYELCKKMFEDDRQRGINFLQERAKEAQVNGVNTEFIQLTGNPGRVICEFASTWSADLILVGSRGLKGLKEMFLGSVSNYITHHAPCSVLIVRNDTNSVAYSADPLHQQAQEEESKQAMFNENVMDKY